MFPEGRLLDFLIVGAGALIVVGPKDLPLLMRRGAQFRPKVRGMAAEFRASFDELARQSELDALRKEVEALRVARPLDMALNPPTGGGLHEVFSDIRGEVDAAHRDFRAAANAAEAPAAVSDPSSTPSPA